MQAGSWWRFYAVITFLNQISRVPLILSVARDAQDLSAYFVIAATSIPVQFIALEILQYRSRGHQVSMLERFGVPSLALLSIAYVFGRHGIQMGWAYLAFSAALLIYGASVGRVRERSDARYILAVESVYNTMATGSAVAITATVSGSPLGYAVILSQAAVAVLMSICNWFVYARRQIPPCIELPGHVAIYNKKHAATAPLVLSAVMVTTQLERLIVSSYQPMYLASISLAAGVMQAWRKVGMDDALVFDRLRRGHAGDIADAMVSELNRARLVFLPALILAGLAYLNINDVFSFAIAHGILKSLSQESFTAAAAILCIYFSAMPSAIVMLNTLRQRTVHFSLLGWWSLLAVAVLEIFVLIWPDVVSSHLNTALVVISAAASLSFMLFAAQFPRNAGATIRLLILDFLIFLTVIAVLVWIPAH